MEILSQEDIGSFIVRDSTTHPSCFALSVRVPKFENPSGISHYLIKQTPKGGYMLKVSDVMFWRWANVGPTLGQRYSDVGPTSGQFGFHSWLNFKPKLAQIREVINSGLDQCWLHLEQTLAQFWVNIHATFVRRWPNVGPVCDQRRLNLRPKLAEIEEVVGPVLD